MDNINKTAMRNADHALSRPGHNGGVKQSQNSSPEDARKLFEDALRGAGDNMHALKDLNDQLLGMRDQNDRRASDARVVLGDCEAAGREIDRLLRAIHAATTELTRP